MMRVLLSAALVFCAVARGSAQGDVSAGQAASVPASLAPKGTPAQGILVGNVLCDDTRRPARGALVTVLRLKDGAADAQIGFGPLSLTHVRTDGTYVVEHLAEGSYAVFASLAGYLSDVDQFLAADQKPEAAAVLHRKLEQHGIVLVRANTSARADLTLERGASLSGRVLYADGSPAPSLSLLLEDTKSHSSAAQDARTLQEQMERSLSGVMFKHGTATTDDLGRFRLAGLQAGTYRLAATLPTWENNDSESGEELGMAIFGMADPRALRVYAGDTLHRANAKSFALRPGEDVSGVDIVVPVDAFHDLRGTVIAKDGRPVNMGQVTLRDTTDDQFSFHADISRDGSFVVRQVPAGTYTLITNDVRLGEVDKTAPAEMPESMRALVPVAAFADASRSVLVKDSEVDGLNLVVTEVPFTNEENRTPRFTPIPSDGASGASSRD